MSVKWKTTERRIGIVGPSWSGKTVFLTSLINHLQSHEPDRFEFAKRGSTICGFDDRHPLEPAWPVFQYAQFRNRLVNGQWPDKTTDCSAYICCFERTDWKYSDVLLRLYDLPGERINDVAMVRHGTRDYDTWSDHVIGRIQNDVDYLNRFTEFFKLLGGTPSEADVMSAYRLGMARLWLAYKPYLTPSTFLLDRAGRPCKGREAEQVAAERHAGFAPSQEFCPLPAGARARNAELVGRFALRFERYRDEIVEPWVRAVKSCHGLVILVDVLQVLASGHGMYNDYQQLIQDLLLTLDPKDTLFDAFLRNVYEAVLPYQWRRSWISRVAFVAPKVDRVHPEDRKKVASLLEQMTRRFKANLEADGVKCELFRVMAVRSTKEGPPALGQRKLLGRTLLDAQGQRVPPPGQEKVYTVSEVPAAWPTDWREKDFVFPEVYPYIPPKLDSPPDQEELNRVFDFLVW